MTTEQMLRHVHDALSLSHPDPEECERHECVVGSVVVEIEKLLGTYPDHAREAALRARGEA